MSQFKISIYKDKRQGRNKPWLVRWFGEYKFTADQQKRYCKSFSTKKEAERFIAQKNEEFQAGLPRDEKNISLADLTDKFLRVNMKSYTIATVKHYQATIKRLKNHFNPDISIKNIRQEDAQEFISQIDFIHKYFVNRGKEMSDSTRSNQLRNCRKIFNVAVEWGYIRKNPFDNISQTIDDKKNWHYITPDEFESVLSKATNIRIKVLYAVQYGCGLRSGEALNLLWNRANIDFENNRITLVNRPGSLDIPPFILKDKEARSIPAPKWVIDLLTQLQSESQENCPFVFLTADRLIKIKEHWHKLVDKGRTREWQNRDLQNNTLRDFKKCCRRAGIKTNDRLVLHCLRKSWASNLANSGVPAHTLMKLGGWSSIETVMQFYLKSSDENEKKAVEILDKLVKVE